MPVYLRRNVTFTPSSLGEFPPEDHCDADYLLDPEQHRDELPQPYRMVNKVLTKLIDAAWEILDSREQKRVAEACKIRPPQYECAISMQDHPSVCCMSSSPDGAVVVVGTRTGLAAIDGPGHQTLGSLDLGAAVINIQVSLLGPDIYMVAAIDHAGAAELYILSSGRFYFLEKLNEQQEGGSKLLATRLEASSGGHYVGVYLENAAGKDGVLQVYKLPKDVWLKEVEQALSKEPDKPTTDVPHDSSPRPPTDLDAPIEYSHPSEGPVASNEADHADDAANQLTTTRSSYSRQQKALVLYNKNINSRPHHQKSKSVTYNAATGRVDMSLQLRTMTKSPGISSISAESQQPVPHLPSPNVPAGWDSQGHQSLESLLSAQPKTDKMAYNNPTNKASEKLGGKKASRSPKLDEYEARTEKTMSAKTPAADKRIGNVSGEPFNLGSERHDEKPLSKMPPARTNSRISSSGRRSDRPLSKMSPGRINSSHGDRPLSSLSPARTNSRVSSGGRLDDRPTSKMSPARTNSRISSSGRDDDRPLNKMSPARTNSRVSSSGLRDDRPTSKMSPARTSSKISSSRSPSATRKSSSKSHTSSASSRNTSGDRKNRKKEKNRLDTPQRSASSKSGKRESSESDRPVHTSPSMSSAGLDESMTTGSPKTGSPRAPTADKMSFKFTPSNLILKVKPPGPVQGVQWQSPLALLKTCDSGDVIGTGASHQISQIHLEQRNEVFTNLHKHHLPYLQQADIRDNHMCPTFHFLTPGRMLAQGLENAALAGMDQPNTVAVWWRGHHQLSQYSLLKSSKVQSEDELSSGKKSAAKSKSQKQAPPAKPELEHKADQMWPQAEMIVASAVSAATSLIALGLRNGHLVIWDKYLGMHRRLLQVTEENNIAQLHFLDSRICPQECTNYPPYDTRTNCYVLVWCYNGKLILVNCGLWSSEEPQDVSAELESEGDQYCQVIPVQGIPELVLTCRHNGNMFIHDILDGKVLCQVKLPDPFTLLAPWEPTVSIGAQGETLYIKGTSPDASEEPGSTNSAVFVFQLRSFPTLDGYRTLPRPDVPEVVHSTVENRVNALLTERMTQQVLRKSRMQERWYKMKDELELMKKARNTTKTPKSFSVSTIERSIVNASPEKSII